jgi:hypothetical protein
VPEVPISPEGNLTLSVQQDGAFPAQEPVEKRQATSLAFNQPTGGSASSNPNSFSGQLSPAFAGASVRVAYTPDNPQNVNGTITHTVTTDEKGVWQDQVNFVYDNNSQTWTAKAFFDGNANYAGSESNTVQFFVGD